MRTLSSLLIVSCFGVLSACTLLVEVKDPPENNANNANNVNNINNTNNTNNQSCGNGVREATEECDGTDHGQATCVGLGYGDGTLVCDQDCRFDVAGCGGADTETICDDDQDNDRDGSTDCDDSDCISHSACQGGYCGDGAVNGSEQCDGSDLNGATCLALGYDGGQLLCDPTTCTFILSGCQGDVCGDGHLSDGEQCEDTNLRGTTCSDWGFYQGALACLPTQCKLDFSGCTGNPQFSNPMQVEAGDEHTCVKISSGEILCWGSDLHGQLGIDSGQMFQPVPVKVSHEGTWLLTSDLSTGGKHTCVVGATPLFVGKIICWGDNAMGQLGDGTNTMSPVPVTVSGSVDNFVAVSAGSEHTCALDGDRKVWCWGSNSDGQLGVGSSYGTSVNNPVMVNLDEVIAISAGHRHTCAIKEINASSHELYCWGSNSNGQLGVGSGYTGATDIPAPVALNNPRTVSCGDTHTCAIDGNDNVYCWGDNLHGQCGTGTTGSFAPLNVSGLSAFTISAGADHTCATQGATGDIYCWGRNDRGQLGLGDTSQRNLPVRIVELDSVTQVSGGGLHTCAIGQLEPIRETQCLDGNDEDGDGYTDCADTDCFFTTGCYGSENTQALCSDNVDNDSDQRTDCNDPDCFSVAICQGSEACSNGVDDDGDGLLDCLDPYCYADPMCIMSSTLVFCWGANESGQLGDASTLDELSPVPVAGQ